MYIYWPGALQRNGEEVAVKVFSSAAMQRSPEVQVREFQVMMQLKQENVVQLLGIEEEVSVERMWYSC